jgi:hypothetical protein
VTKDEAQRRPSTLLRTVSLSNGLSNGRWTFYEAVTWVLTYSMRLKENRLNDCLVIHGRLIPHNGANPRALSSPVFPLFKESRTGGSNGMEGESLHERGGYVMGNKGLSFL